MKTTVINLINKGFNPTEQQMEFIKKSMPGWNLYYCLSKEAFDFAMADLKYYLQEFPFEDNIFSETALLENIMMFCNAVTMLDKDDSVDFRKIHLQYRMPVMNAFKPIHICRDIYFFVDYIRYLRRRQELEDELGDELGDALSDICPMYIPNYVIEASNRNFIKDFIMRSLNKIEAILSDNDVVEKYERYKSLETSFVADGVEYIAMVPRCAFDVIKESTCMRNCMGSRLSQYANGEWLYIFIRRADEANVPLIDAIISTGKYGKMAGPEWVITEGHQNVFGTPLQPVFDAYFKSKEDLIKSFFYHYEDTELDTAV